jgi:hypothetical protein
MATQVRLHWMISFAGSLGVGDRRSSMLLNSAALLMFSRQAARFHGPPPGVAQRKISWTLIFRPPNRISRLYGHAG